MRLEHEKGSLHASHVRQAFLQVLRANLPTAAFAELDSMPMERERVELWADAHGINAPCVVEAFACFCQGGWSSCPDYEGDSWEAPPIPREWLERIGQLNTRGIDPWAWRGVYADEYSLDEAWRGRITTVSPNIAGKAIDRHLGPIATDPSRESWEDFQDRARSHWRARVLLAESFGFRPAGKETEWPNLARDIKWLFRHRVNRETYEEIAGRQDREESLDPDTVKKAIDRVSRTIGIKRKQGPRAKGTNR